VEQVIDSSIWIDHLRASSPLRLKKQTHTIIISPDMFICEPVHFEILRAAPFQERGYIERLTLTIPSLLTPKELWKEALQLDRVCCKAGFRINLMDLLIAQICIHHHFPLITFDRHFLSIAKCSDLELNLLKREIS